MRLERKLMLEVEGATERECLRIMRHEAGHALSNAYRLHYKRRWRELFGSFRRKASPETEEHLEGRMAAAVEELKTKRFLAVEMAGLCDREHGPDLSPADVHIQGLRLNIEEVASRAEVPELAVGLEGCSSIGNQDMHLAKRFQLMQRAGVEEHTAGDVRGEGEGWRLGGELDALRRVVR